MARSPVNIVLAKNMFLPGTKSTANYNINKLSNINVSRYQHMWPLCMANASSDRIPRHLGLLST